MNIINEINEYLKCCLWVVKQLAQCGLIFVGGMALGAIFIFMLAL